MHLGRILFPVQTSRDTSLRKEEVVTLRLSLADESFHLRKKQNRNSILPSLPSTDIRKGAKGLTYQEAHTAKGGKKHMSIFAYILDLSCFWTAPFPLPFPRQCGMPGHHSSAKYHIIKFSKISGNEYSPSPLKAGFLLTYLYNYLLIMLCVDDIQWLCLLTVIFD